MTTATSQQAVATPQVGGRRYFRFGDFAKTPHTPISAATIGGPFSLVGETPLEIAAQPGLIIQVRKGSIWVKYAGDNACHFVRSGERFISDHDAPLAITTTGGAELDVT